MYIVTSGSKYIDIDAYATIIAYANLLNLKGIPAKAVSTSKLNESITSSLLNLNIGLDSYTKSDSDRFIIVDVSNKEFFDKIVDDKRIVEIIDHHFGFEEYWNSILKEKSRIEFIGAVATIIVEDYEKNGLLDSMSKDIAILLMSAILDNTLNLKAKITNERDINAYIKLSKLVGNVDKYAENYFLECQKLIEENIEKSIENDTKAEKICETLPYAFSQLTLWNKDYIINNKEKLYKTLEAISPEWMLNLISLEEGKSYIIASNEIVKRKLERLFNKSFNKDIMELDSVWLRKEIIKKAKNI